MTVEDPIEYELAGITQIQVETKRNVTFASALRSILRQDPDVIFVGEIRDAETAEVAAQAAATGHLVLATLHTNDAMSAVSRLSDLGLDRTTISSVLRGSVAQRLMRRVCTDCVQPIAGALKENEERLAAQFGVQPTYRTVGCAKCNHTGYRGRLPVVEVAVVNSSIIEQIAAGATAAVLQRSAITQGMRPLRDVALEHVRNGETTLEEVERVLGEVADDAPLVPASPRRRPPFSSPTTIRCCGIWPRRSSSRAGIACARRATARGARDHRERRRHRAGDHRSPHAGHGRQRARQAAAQQSADGHVARDRPYRNGSARCGGQTHGRRGG